MTTNTRIRRTRRLTIGAAAGLALALGAPLAAAAHVHVDPGTASAGATQTLTFSFAHGCDDSPTTALTIDIPDGVANATPAVQGGWTIARELGADGVPTRVVYTADTPVDCGRNATGSIDVLLAEGAAGTPRTPPVDVASERVTVVDTVGAGDTFDAGVLASLKRNNLLTKAAVANLSDEAVREALALGARAAAVTVSRAGANPPWRHELGL